MNLHIGLANGHRPTFTFLVIQPEGSRKQILAVAHRLALDQPGHLSRDGGSLRGGFEPVTKACHLEVRLPGESCILQLLVLLHPNHARIISRLYLKCIEIAVRVLDGSAMFTEQFLQLARLKVTLYGLSLGPNDIFS